MPAFVINNRGEAVPANITFQPRGPFHIDRDNNFVGTMPSGIVQQDIERNKLMRNIPEPKPENDVPKTSKIWTPDWSKK